MIFVFCTRGKNIVSFDKNLNFFIFFIYIKCTRKMNIAKYMKNWKS